MKNFDGKILFLDRGDINTDEIIPARYLTEARKEALAPYCLEDLALPGFDAKRDLAGAGAIITRRNFGCGSSREHAPWALEYNGINIVIAVNFARIFRQNMFNCGMLAIELAEETIDEIFREFAGAPAELHTDLDKLEFTITGSGKAKKYPFAVGAFDLALVRAGGWVAYADKKY